MAGLGDTRKNEVLDQLLRGVAFPTITLPIKISVHSADPGGSGTVGEAAGGSYARQSATFGAASGGTSNMAAAIDFVNMPGATFTHIGFWDSTGTPKFIGSVAMSSSVVVTAGNTLRMTSISASQA